MAAQESQPITVLLQQWRSCNPSAPPAPAPSTLHWRNQLQSRLN